MSSDLNEFNYTITESDTTLLDSIYRTTKIANNIQITKKKIKCEQCKDSRGWEIWWTMNKPHIRACPACNGTGILEIEDPNGLVKPDQEINGYLSRSISEFNLSTRSYNYLQNTGIKLIGELVQQNKHEMLKTKNFGRKSLKEIEDLLAKMNLRLGMNVNNWNQE